MIRELLWFDCPICDKPFMSYCYGKIMEYCHEDSICFTDYTLGEIHSNSYLNCIQNLRKCRKCRVSHQLEEYTHGL